MTHIQLKISIGSKSIVELFPNTKKGNREAEKYLKAIAEKRETDDFYKLCSLESAAQTLEEKIKKSKKKEARKRYEEALSKAKEEIDCMLLYATSPVDIKVEINHIVKDDSYINDLL